MPEHNGTANLLAQMTAFRELKEDYNAEVAECLTVKNLKRNGINASVSDVQGWEKINNAALHGNLDIQREATLAEGKAATATGNAITHVSTNAPNLNADNYDQTAEIDYEDTDDVDDNEEESELLTIDEMYGYDDPEDNLEAAQDDILKIQENS